MALSKFHNMSTDEVIQKMLFLKEEMYEAEGEVIVRQMFTFDNNKPRNLHCENKECLENGMCASLFTGNMITNRRDLSKPHEITSFFKCDVLKTGTNEMKEGIYCIICNKPGCNIRGVIYFGSSADVSHRLRLHRRTIRDDVYMDARRAVHHHFLEPDHTVDDDPLHYFLCARVQLVGGGQRKREGVERQFILKFGTLREYGCNEKLPAEDNEPTPPPPPTPTKRSGSSSSTTPSPAQLAIDYGRIPKPRMKDEIWFALLLKNLAPGVKPTTLNMSLLAQIYFKPESQINTKWTSMTAELSRNLNQKGLDKLNEYTRTTWFRRTNPRTDRVHEIGFSGAELDSEINRQIMLEEDVLRAELNNPADLQKLVPFSLEEVV